MSEETNDPPFSPTATDEGDVSRAQMCVGEGRRLMERERGWAWKKLLTTRVDLVVPNLDPPIRGSGVVAAERPVEL